MSRQKHSFVPFYFDDWKGGTNHMTRLVRSVYFDLCLFTWDKMRAVPRATVKLMLADLGDQGAMIVDALVEDGSLVRNEDGSIYSPRALEEGQKAYRIWEGKSAGGRHARIKSDETKPQHRSKSARHTIPLPEPEPEDSSPSESSHFGAKDIVAGWNDMAASCGLPQVAKVTEERAKRLKARIEEHGAEPIVEAIKEIPETPFLLGENDRGWKANFDFLLVPRNCAKLIEGAYKRDERGSWSR